MISLVKGWAGPTYSRHAGIGATMTRGGCLWRGEEEGDAVFVGRVEPLPGLLSPLPSAIRAIPAYSESTLSHVAGLIKARPRRRATARFSKSVIQQGVGGLVRHGISRMVCTMMSKNHPAPPTVIRDDQRGIDAPRNGDTSCIQARMLSSFCSIFSRLLLRAASM
jgi:hypothetical protein